MLKFNNHLSEDINLKCYVLAITYENSIIYANVQYIYIYITILFAFIFMKKAFSHQDFIKLFRRFFGSLDMYKQWVSDEIIRISFDVLTYAHFNL